MGNFDQADFSPDSSVKKPLSGSNPWLGGDVFLVADTGSKPKPAKGGESSDSSAGTAAFLGSLLKGSLTPEAMANLLPTLLKNPEFRKSLAEFMDDPKIRASLLSTFTELMKKPEFKETMSSMFKDLLKDKQFQSTLFEMMKSPEFRAAAKPLVADLANDPQVRQALKGAALELINDPQMRQALKTAALEMIGNGQLLQPLMAALRNPQTIRQIMSALPMIINGLMHQFGGPNFGQGGMPPYWNMSRNNMGPWGPPPFATNRFAPFAPPYSPMGQMPFGFGQPFNRRANPWMMPQNWTYFNPPPSTTRDIYIPPWTSDQTT
jgi:hypothetical protein